MESGKIPALGFRFSFRACWWMVRALWSWKVRHDLQRMAEHLARTYSLFYPKRYGRIRPTGTRIEVPWRGAALAGEDEREAPMTKRKKKPPEPQREGDYL